MKPGDVEEFKIMNFTTKGEGVTFLQDGRIIIISGVNEADEVVKAKIISVGMVSTRAEKISRVRSQEPEVESVKIDGSPYELDEDENDDSDDDDYEEPDDDDFDESEEDYKD